MYYYRHQSFFDMMRRRLILIWQLCLSTPLTSLFSFIQDKYIRTTDLLVFIAVYILVADLKGGGFFLTNYFKRLTFFLNKCKIYIMYNKHDFMILCILNQRGLGHFCAYVG